MPDTAERGNRIMAIFHFTVKIVGRSKGKSVISASAYLNGDVMKNEETGRISYYTSKKEVVYTSLMMCENAPPEWLHVPEENIKRFQQSIRYKRADDKDAALEKFKITFQKQRLWNEVLKIEKNADAQLGRSFEFSLPKEWSTDLICVSGDLGAAYMGLQLLEREKAVFQDQKEANPDFSGKEYILERQLKPEARKDIIEELAQAGVKPTAMMDISDGLSSELLHICSQSDTGCRVYEERIPIDYQTAVMAEELNMNVTTCALNGGEDYELLFTVPLTDHEKVSTMKGVKVIGHITKPELGCALVTRDGQEFELKAQGWNPLKEK